MRAALSVTELCMQAPSRGRQCASEPSDQGDGMLQKQPLHFQQKRMCLALKAWMRCPHRPVLLSRLQQTAQARMSCKAMGMLSSTQTQAIKGPARTMASSIVVSGTSSTSVAEGSTKSTENTRSPGGETTDAAMCPESAESAERAVAWCLAGLAVVVTPG